MDYRYVFGVVIIVGILAVFFAMPGEHEEFAKCVGSSGAKMYGAYWCTHCEKQKEMFGKSFNNIQYVECSLPNNGGQTELCKNAQIIAYPTWEFGSGEKITGELSMQEISIRSGCKIN